MTALLSNIKLRVVIFTVFAYLKVEVISCGIACASHISDKLTLFYSIAVFSRKLCLMSINRNVAVLMLNDYAVAVTAVPACACVDYRACFCGIDGSTVGSGNINALMTSAVALMSGNISAVNRR